MRLIDADALKESIAEFHQKQKERLHNPLWESIGINNLNKLIDNAPTVRFVISQDYVTELQNINKELIKQLEETERLQGEWIEIKRNLEDGKHSKFIFRCPFCGYVEGYKANFCGKCGAEMQKGEET